MTACANCGSAPEQPCADACPLPRETVRAGVRYCRHHGDEPIAGPGYPCRMCWKEGREPADERTDDDPSPAQ